MAGDGPFDPKDGDDDVEIPIEDLDGWGALDEMESSDRTEVEIPALTDEPPPEFIVQEDLANRDPKSTLYYPGTAPGAEQPQPPQAPEGFGAAEHVQGEVEPEPRPKRSTMPGFPAEEEEGEEAAYIQDAAPVSDQGPFDGTPPQEVPFQPAEGYDPQPSYDAQAASGEYTTEGYAPPQDGGGEPAPVEAMIAPPHQPAYQEPEPAYEEPEPAYQEPEPAYQEAEPAYQEAEPAYQEAEPEYQEAAPAPPAPASVEAAPSPRTSSPPIEPLPLDKPLPEGDNTWLTKYQIFKAVSQKLARVGDWRKLAAVTGNALIHAPYAERMTRTGMLLDLARVYRDRLKDEKRAEEAFAVLAKEDPSNAEALTYLIETYEKRGDWGAVYDIYLNAVEATWDPKERLSWTKQAADLAFGKLNNPGLAIRAWEHLWNLGDAVEDASRELTRLYRRAGRWAELADFLQEQADRLEGFTKLVVLRELAEVKLSGIKDPDGASKVLEQIVEMSPQDPIATLQLARVYAQRQDWSSLQRLGQQAASDEVPPEAALDLQHLVADSLWQADRLEEAVEAYDRILQVAPADYDGNRRKQEFLTRTGRFEELLNLVIAEADNTSQEEERASLLAKAAALAEEKLGDHQQAVELWESRIAIDAEHMPAFEALARLYDNMDDQRGVARALEGQLKVAKDVATRIELLRKLGQHYASRLEEDERAEACWKEILSLDSSDLPAREDLADLHRRRGDFEALNSALMRQIWLTDDDQRAQHLCRLAAQNLDENFEDPGRSAEAWQRVLDFSPMDLPALQALKGHYEQLQQRHKLIATLEREIRASAEIGTKIDLARQVAALWEEEEDYKGSAESFERILRWDPINELALEGLVRIYKQAGEAGKAIGALEHAASLVDDIDKRIELLRRALALLPEEDRFTRFFQLRRILFLARGNREVLEELKAEAEAADKEQAEVLWPELAAVLVQLSCQEPSDWLRLELARELAWVYEKKLSSKVRGYLALQSVLISPEHGDKVLEEITRLAQSTKRHEDLMALLDRLTTPDFHMDDRKDVICQRAAICEKDLKSPTRAFHELRRLLDLDPADQGPLEELERLAGENDLWRQLDAIYAELWDRAEDTEQRADLLTRRAAIARDHLDSQQAAFDLLVRKFRIDAEDLDLLKELTEDAEALGGWDWLLPILEASQLCSAEDTAAKELALTAALFEHKLEDKERAFTLYALAFTTNPSAEDLADKLEELAADTGRHDTLATIFREAASVYEVPDQTMDLLRRTTRIYEDKLDAPARAIDIHRRLLHLREDEMRSLEVMIEWHRNSSEWRDLRDRLEQWIRLCDEEDRVPKLLEVAQISEQYLADPETALETYGKILELDSEHDAARDGLKGLVVSIAEPGMRIRWLRMEMKNADEAGAAGLQLEIAQIQEQQAEDVPGAITTLRQLCEETGPDGPAFEPLSRLLRETEQWKELVLLLKATAETTEVELRRMAALDDAIEIYHEHLEGVEQELGEDLYRAVLTHRPTDQGIRVRLARFLRGAGRFEELCELLTQNLEHLTDARDSVSALYEVARLQALNLEQLDDAKGSWERILEIAPDEEGAILNLASAAGQAGDVEGYVAFRQKQAEHLDPHDSALVLCHLAEVADENEALADRKVPFYREARRVDPGNVPAMEALKGIGRRLKNLRPAAALLPLEGERDLEPTERAKRLKALGDGALESDPVQATEWYHRATITDPDNAENWEALASALNNSGDLPGAAQALSCWLRALEREEAVEPDALATQAERLYRVARAARAADDKETYAHLIHHAYDLVPNHAPSALDTAQTMIDDDDIEGAYALLHGVLSQYIDDLTEEQRLRAHFFRGLTLRRLERLDEATEDFRDALALDPLHADALMALGEIQANSNRYAAALEHQIRALTVVEQGRGRLYHRIGVLWEDGLGATDEAGACYELALAGGVEERDLLHRSLLHLQRTGRLDQSLEVVDNLLPTAHDPEELATLWLVRGEIFAAREGKEDEAIEAFDMALSYDPARQEAREGLTMVLERRGDWNQLLQVLEATCDVAEPEQHAAALRRMADICSLQLNDQHRAEEYLRQSVEVCPTREALEYLERIYTPESGRVEERKEIVGMLVGFGPPWFERCMELSKLLLADEKTWAWCLISPLLGVSQVDPDIKAVVQAMRKEFERPAVLCSGEQDIPLLRHPDVDVKLAEVLAEVSAAAGPFGVTSLDEAGDGGAIAISENTNMGKIFAATATALGLEGCTLHRTQSLPDAVQVVDSGEEAGPAVVVRTEVIQQLVHAEVGFFFAYALELARPGHRAMSSLPADQRDSLLPGLWLALGFTEEADAAASALANKIKEATEQEALDYWAEQLEHLRDEDPLELGRRWWEGVGFTARRAGLVAGADLRQVFRVMSRLTEEVARPRVVARIDELDEYVAASPKLQDLVAFSASPAFGKLLRGAKAAMES